MNNSLFTNEHDLRLLTAETITNGASKSVTVGLAIYEPTGFMAIQLRTTGGTLAVTMKGSINGVDIDDIDGVSAVAAAHTAGNKIYLVAPGVPLFNLELTFTASVADVVANAWLVVQ